MLAPFPSKIKFKPLATVEDPSPLITPPLRTHSPGPHGASGCGNAESQSGCGSPARGKNEQSFGKGVSND